MLEQAVSHLFEGQAHVLEADFLGHEIERHRWKASMHFAHDARQHRAITHAGVEDPYSGWPRMDVRELHTDAARDHLFLATGIDEQEIFLPVVEKAESPGGSAIPGRPLGASRSAGGSSNQSKQFRRRLWCGGAMAGHVRAHALERFRRDACTVAQAGHELAVVDGAAAESGLGDAVLPAKRRYAVEQASVQHGFHRHTHSSEGEGGKSTTTQIDNGVGYVPLHIIN